MRNSSPFRLLLAAAAAAALVACGGSASNSGGSAAQPTADVGSGQLQGAGSTFVEPFFTKAFYQYNADHSKVSVNYQAIGSGGGIQQFTKGTVDFGATDVPMTAAEVAAAGGDAALVQLPSTIGVAAISYNLPAVDNLKLDGATLADIYLGKIKTWDDPKLKALNSGAKLPSSAITLVHRSDGSGTSYAFTDYLSKVSPEWKSTVGVGKSVQWPAGTGGKGNEGVGQAVKSTDGAIGYVELAYVIQSKLQTAQVKNHSGKFVAPSIGGATAAAATLQGLSPTNFSITDAPGDSAYPISTYSWVMLKTNQADPQKGKALVELFKWLVTGGQPISKDLQYAPLPKEASDFSLAQLKKVKVA
ncbi:MAG: phosphate ABC transporter substrate-binding protein PstS [Candidatus Dormibacter sp.]|uniref:phosphate ABC transporter substrate-binding protein PstS n=1 Tax=Candidatus Dormibacter sp. TaxID=2973982 RepID=UPI000DB075EE|nr:MAG: phosphate ABC transporter substrate-binding protein PstS [Candidatus Dormibacteraeota bacterium]